LEIEEGAVKLLAQLLICGGFVAVSSVSTAAVVTVTLSVPVEITTEFLEDSFPFDVDQNGFKDFILFGSISGASIQPLGYNRVAIEVDPPPDLAGVLTAFRSGELIGAEIRLPLAFYSADFTGDGFVEEGEFLSIQIVQCFDSCSYTPFAGGRAYAGFEFERDGLKHYGYFDLSGAPNVKGVALYGWAWETEPGTAIVAGAIPEPSTAVLCGGSAVLLWRRRRSHAKRCKVRQQTP
jgi:hypothetical protein